MSTFKGINTIDDLAQLPGAAGLLRDAGLIEQPTLATGIEKRAVKLVTPSISSDGRQLTLMVAVETANEVNQRQWKARNRRAGAAWKAVRFAIGSSLALLEPFAEHYADGGALCVTFTRLGGRHLDNLANLGPALKGVEDAIAFMLGADDGDPRWHPIARQERCKSIGVGVGIGRL